MSCKDCIHFDACYLVLIYEKEDNENCKMFKNKADFVEVIRCKNCKYYETHLPIHRKVCEKNEGHLIPVQPDDFCSYGERSDDNG